MAEDRKQLIEDLRLLLELLPNSIQDIIQSHNREDELLEVVMDLGRSPAARYVNDEINLRNSEVTRAEIDEVVAGIGAFDDDNRAGIARTLHRISAIRNRRGEIVGLTCRVGRAVYGTIDIISDLVEDGQSILLLGRPGVGKTTMLREMARVLAEKRRVIIVDTSNEIGGDGDIPHPAVGRARRMQVPKPAFQHEVMIEAVENHNPEVIIIDEIGREQEAAAARTINERGVQLIGTAHGNTIENLLLNPTLSDLVGGIESVTLSDEEARRRGTQKTVLERRAPPTFDILIEIQDRQRLAIHRNVAMAVDSMLRGRPLGIELRSRDEDGEIQIEQEEEWKIPASEISRPYGAKNGRDIKESNGPRTSRETNSETGSRVSPKASIPSKTLRIFAYGVARNRLAQAAKSLKVSIIIVDQMQDADVLVTLKSYFRKQKRLISDAQSRKTPVFVLRANTVTQMEKFLAEAFNIETRTMDPFEQAIAEAEMAIQEVRGGQSRIDLRPVGSSIRRYQHQMVRQANLVSHSYGKGSNRHVRIFNTPAN